MDSDRLSSFSFFFSFSFPFFPFVKSYFILFVVSCFCVSLFFTMSMIFPCDGTPSSHRRVSGECFWDFSRVKVEKKNMKKWKFTKKRWQVVASSPTKMTVEEGQLWLIITDKNQTKAGKQPAKLGVSTTEDWTKHLRFIATNGYCDGASQFANWAWCSFLWVLDSILSTLGCMRDATAD